MAPFTFIIIFFLFTCTYFLIGLIASRNIKNTSDYFLAGRNVGFWGVTFTLIATQLGSGMLMGTAEKSYQFGFLGIFYTLSMAAGFLLLSLGFASRLRALNVSTTAEIFQLKYKSPFLKKIASLFSIATLCGILIGQIIASRELLSGALSNSGLSLEVIFLTLWAFIIIYTLLGGLKAVVQTDTFQVIFILIIFGGIFLYLIYSLPSTWFFKNALQTQRALFPVDDLNWRNLLATLMMPALFALIEQDLAQRFFAAKTQRIATAAAVAAGIFLLSFALIPVFFGMLAKVLNYPVIESNPLIVTLQHLTGNTIFALALCGLIAAITSTVDSLLCAISSNIAHDFAFSFTASKNRLRLSQIITLITGIFLVSLSYLIKKDIIDVLIGSYEISVSTLFVPLVIAYFKQSVKRSSAYGAIIFGLASFIYFKYNPMLLSNIITLLVSLSGYILGSFIEK